MQKSNTTGFAFVLGLSGLLLGACQGQAEDEEGTDASEDLVSASTLEGDEAVVEEDEVSVSQEFLATGQATWNQGDPPVPLGSTSDRVCFLLGIKGNFAGSSESAKVYTSNGSWYLGGSSAHTGVSAWASCAHTSSYSKEYTWKKGQAYPTPLHSAAADHVCFLTRVSGGFNSGKEWVHAYVSGGQWYLTGGSSGPYLSGSARCASTTEYTNETSWNQTELAQPLGKYPSTACALTKILGRFDAAGDRLRITIASGDSWYLGGASASGGSVYGRARCF